MAKKRVKKRERSKRGRTQRILNASKISNISKFTFKTIVALIITLIGIMSSYITIMGYWMPRISVQPVNPTSSAQTVSTDFFVTNAGSMSLYNVRVGCRVTNYRFRIVGTDQELLEAASPEDFHDSLDPMKSATMKCSLAPNDAKELDIFIIVYYRPAWYPVEKRQAFRFITKTFDDGQVHWLPQPESDDLSKFY